MCTLTWVLLGIISILVLVLMCLILALGRAADAFARSWRR